MKNLPFYAVFCILLLDPAPWITNIGVQESTFYGNHAEACGSDRPAAAMPPASGGIPRRGFHAVVREKVLGLSAVVIPHGLKEKGLLWDLLNRQLLNDGRNAICIQHHYYWFEFPVARTLQFHAGGKAASLDDFGKACTDCIEISYFDGQI